MSTPNSPLTRTLHPVVKVLNEKEGLVEYIASDESLDSYREIILANGWKFDRFKKNAPFVDSHDYYRIERLLGAVQSFEVRNGQLVEVVKWAIDCPEQKLAALGFQLTLKGYLKAVSVGFIPVRMSWPGKEDWAKAVESAGLDVRAAAECRGIYLEQQQIELSACIIGANPNALAKAFDARDIGEADLASVGFRSERDMQFLLDVGRAWERNTDPMTRAIAQRELHVITGQTYSAPTSRTPAGDGGARQPDPQEEEERRKAFLERLRDHTRQFKR